MASKRSRADAPVLTGAPEVDAAAAAKEALLLGQDEGAAEVVETVKPEAVLSELISIENAAGRQRQCRKADLAFFKKQGYKAL